MSFKRMTELDLDGKRVLIRQDLNVPMKDGRVMSDARLRAGLATIQKALEKGARVMLTSHLGRPKEGEFSREFSLEPVARRLAELLGTEVTLQREWLDGVAVRPGEVVLCENVRFNVGEKANSDELGRKMAGLCDVYVMDAFGTAHRAQASTHKVAEYAIEACAGPLLADEVDVLAKALENPARPLVAIVGGSKVSTKLTLLKSLLGKVDQLIVGGGIANTFIAAAGLPIGGSLYEQEFVADAKELMASVNVKGFGIPLPVDAVCAKELSDSARATTKQICDVGPDDLILDIGPETAKLYMDLLRLAGTIVWNGPVGVFEIDQFGEGTRNLAHAIAQSNAVSIAGGGDTLAAMEKYGVSEGISYTSTGGGAFLEFLEGRKLPALAMLEQRGQ